MRAWSHSRLTFPLGARTRYPLSKYALLRARLVAEGTVGEIGEPVALPWSAVQRTHDPAFVARMRSGALTAREQRVLGLPWSARLVARTLAGLQGTIGAAHDALAHGVGAMLGGGTHHAGHATARGYCMFNDVAIATGELRRAGVARRVLVVDCDVHQGDGTAELLGPDPEAFTVSLQCERNYPFTRIPSDLDVELPAGTADDDYLQALDRALDEALARFPAPDMVFYVAGADPWEGDALGRLALTKDGLRARDELVLGRLAGAGLPTAVTLAGGYAPDVRDTVDIHAQTIAVAALAQENLRTTSSA
ncbi:MAG TPA: histone deacetylase [Baekduia sp.]|uniref:histone deacetylase family protein n=1 Tax=Baekduia sp. TaxID=2600305 RepID=UPI002BBEBC5A|nr:histone deacetylase [Baekduia sp.]HMJ33646.1 histone deacetylase [Baekduia sp.]